MTKNTKPGIGIVPGWDVDAQNDSSLEDIDELRNDSNFKNLISLIQDKIPTWTSEDEFYLQLDLWLDSVLEGLDPDVNTPTENDEAITRDSLLMYFSDKLSNQGSNYILIGKENKNVLAFRGNNLVIYRDMEDYEASQTSNSPEKPPQGLLAKVQNAITSVLSRKARVDSFLNSLAQNEDLKKSEWAYMTSKELTNTYVCSPGETMPDYTKITNSLLGKHDSVSILSDTLTLIRNKHGVLVMKSDFYNKLQNIEKETFELLAQEPFINDVFRNYLQTISTESTNYLSLFVNWLNDTEPKNTKGLNGRYLVRVLDICAHKHVTAENTVDRPPFCDRVNKTLKDLRPYHDLIEYSILSYQEQLLSFLYIKNNDKNSQNKDFLKTIGKILWKLTTNGNNLLEAISKEASTINISWRKEENQIKKTIKDYLNEKNSDLTIEDSEIPLPKYVKPGPSTSLKVVK